ncbi:MAG: CaiB/BaiF CoA-transferase family protein [Arenicellales bacterium]|jgi:formyl-CoA transferase|nr:CaiB/BaiF CoA-transferase family protein [Arenicellales bacterium]MDP6392094.1 CaiB/BaiF CoA-transferase family protein [Arenicellales bacterium]MDP7219978.1 CaiB/BaiF CoA-transferase family protein [Arenicellales bacterium]|tara:strand:+ start:1817 stop:2941 length:1125 start_codon:yes stop_codon:yes gene_type:complete
MGLNRELEGLLVVSMDQAVAAPYCALMLADAGARVIKVERTEGDFARGYDNGADGKSAFFAWLNRGKESVSVDLNKTEDAMLLHNMVMQADVFLHNLAPGALARRGFDGKALRAENPALITCEITGYGSTGQAAKKKAYDFLVQAESGICAVSGTEADPARVGISICDISSGLTAFSTILRALIQRGRTGRGIDISISMFDVMADFMNFPLLAHRYLGGAPARMGLTHALIAPYGAYRTADGNQVLIAIQSDREWQIFCEIVLEQPDLANDDRFINNTARVSHRFEMDESINSVFGQMSLEALMELLDSARIANGRLSSVEDLSNHEFLKKQIVNYGGTAIELAALPVPIDGDRPLEVPTLNQHGDRIRQEFQS